MLRIFNGRDLFGWDGAVELLRDLLGMNAAKPFECVGTKEETLAALHLCIEKYRQQGVSLPAALQTIHDAVLSSRSDLRQVARRVLSSWTDQHYLPSDIASVFRD